MASCSDVLREAVGGASLALEYVLSEAGLTSAAIAEARVFVSRGAVSSLDELFALPVSGTTANRAARGHAQGQVPAALEATLSPVPAEALEDEHGELRWAMRVLCAAG